MPVSMDLLDLYLLVTIAAEVCFPLHAITAAVTQWSHSPIVRFVTKMASTTTTIQPIFTVNERVLCYHGPLIYEAKVLKSHHHDETTTPSGQVGAHYFVHYKGWKQTYFFSPSFLNDHF